MDGDVTSPSEAKSPWLSIQPMRKRDTGMLAFERGEAESLEIGRRMEGGSAIRDVSSKAVHGEIEREVFKKEGTRHVKNRHPTNAFPF